MLIRSPFHYIFQEHWYNLMEIPKFVKLVTYAHSYIYIANDVRRLTPTWYHLIPKLDEPHEYIIHVILTPTSLFHHVFFSQFFRNNYLTRTSKLFQPVCLPTPNCNQRLTPFHCLSSSWQRSTYKANRPHPSALTHSLDCTSDVCIVPVNHFYTHWSTNSFH